MKKAVIIGFLALFPIIGFAQVDRSAGIEFLTPLVQTIIRLLHERIAVLQKEVDTCNAKLHTQTIPINPIASSSPISYSAFDFKLSSYVVGNKVILTADGFRDKESVRGGFKWRTESGSNQVIVSEEMNMVFLPQKEGVNEKIQFTAEIPLEKLSPYNTRGYTKHYFQFRFARGWNSISTSDSVEFAIGY